jgi:hypothetical protein
MFCSLQHLQNISVPSSLGVLSFPQGSMANTLEVTSTEFCENQRKQAIEKRSCVYKQAYCLSTLRSVALYFHIAL